jgi:hypothetical protein
MHYVNAALGVVLVALACFQFIDGNLALAAALFGGGFLALITLKRSMSLFTVNVFAVATVVAMFFYFAGFFQLVPQLHHWYMRGEALHCLGLLFAAFAMIPVLSEYSCRKKSEQCEHSRFWQRHFRHTRHQAPAPK